MSMSWPLKEKNKKIRYFIFEKKSPISAFFSFVFLLLIILPITYCLDNTSRDVPVSNWKFTASNGYHYKYDEFPKNLKEYSILKGTTASASDLKKFLPGLAFNYKNPDIPNASIGYYTHEAEWLYRKEGESEVKPLLPDVELPAGVYDFISTPGKGGSVDYTRLDYTMIPEIERTITIKIICYEGPLKVVQSADPDGVTLNVFDYDVSEIRGAPDNEAPKNWKDVGINAGHLFLFNKSLSSQLGDWNSSYFKAGVVQNTLVDGYPVLNPETFGNVTVPWEAFDSGVGKKDESLAYLFDPDISHSGKQSYKNVTGLFQIDEDGYYYYDYRKNFAELVGGINAPENGAEFNLYNKPGRADVSGFIRAGEFYPFNSHDLFFAEDGSQLFPSPVDKKVNHYFGIALTVPFRQPKDGKITNNVDSNKDMIYEFLGDDDVWVFIDDVLILDLGGCHGAINGYINFATGEITNYGLGKTTIRDKFKAAGKEDSVEWNGNTFYDNTNHTLKMFYLERANTDSSMYVNFNLQSQLHQQIKKVDPDGNPLVGAKFELYQSDKEGNRTSEKLSTLVTNAQGDATFRTADGKLLNFGDRYSQSLSNIYYVLEEVESPEGYRKSPENIVLEYHPQEDILKVYNRYTTGAYSSFDARIKGNAKVYYADYNSEDDSMVISPSLVEENSQKNGLILAVPMIKLSKSNKWVPLYGNNFDGYNSISEDSSKDKEYNWNKTSLMAALLQVYEDEDTSWRLFWNDEKQNLNGEMYELPGSADRYLFSNTSGDMRMEYLMLSPNILNKFGINNTTEELSSYIKRKITNEENVEDVISVIADEILSYQEKAITEKYFSFVNINAFEHTYRSIIYIPNETRELRVKKVDEEGNALNGAEFSLFESIEDAKKETNPIATGTTTTINKEDGMLIFNPKIENTVGYANVTWNNYEVGTVLYLKETKTLKGYTLNETIIPIVIGVYSVYADAGDSNDGVAVKAGVGKLTQTMKKYATDDEVNISLRDIIAYGQVQDSGTFNINGWVDNDESMNLHYKVNSIIDYGLHSGDEPYIKTDVGFLRTRVVQNYSVHQDDEYASLANKDNIGDKDITSLFRLINIVEVSNTEQNRIISGIAFEDIDKDDLYTQNKDILLPGIKVSLYNENMKKEGETTTDENGYYIFDNLPRINYYVQFEIPSGSVVVEKGTSDTSNKANLDGLTDELIFVLPNRDKVIKLENINLGLRSTNLVFTKIEVNDESKPIINAGLFELYEYICEMNDEAYKDKLVDEKEECFKKRGESITTNEEGKVIFAALNPATYRLVERKAPEGFMKPSGEWNVEVTQNGSQINMKIECVGGEGRVCPAFKKNEEALYLPNIKVAEIPNSGGLGVIMMTITGVSVMGLGICYLYKFDKKYKKRRKI